MLLDSEFCLLMLVTWRIMEFGVFGVFGAVDIKTLLDVVELPVGRACRLCRGVAVGDGVLGFENLRCVSDAELACNRLERDDIRAVIPRLGVDEDGVGGADEAENVVNTE